MSKCSSLLVVCLGLVGLFLASCNDTKNPLSDPQQSKADAALLGVWRLAGANGEVNYYHASRAGGKLPEAVLHVKCVRHSKDGKETPSGEMLVFPSAIGDHNYLNAVITDQSKINALLAGGWNSDVVPSYTIMRYRLDGDKLTVEVINDMAKLRAIQAKRIKGLIEGSPEKPTKVELTATSEHLAQFVEKAGDDLFARDVLRLERVK
jgi:hypothetical protein